MPTSVRYVRLAEHLSRGGRYDLHSGWGISGLDVKEMPDEDSEPEAFAYVQGEIRAGRLEGASRAEYDETHPDIAGDLGYKLSGTEDGVRPYQEREVQREARKANAKVRARRSGEAEADAFAADQRRREAVLAAQEGQAKRAGSRGTQKAAAEAEEEAERANTEALRLEAERRAQGAAPVLGANVGHGEVDVDDEEDDEDDGNDRYEAMGKAALVEEAKSREVAHSGSADAIRDRLRAADAEDEDNTDDEDDEDDESESDDDGGSNE